MTTKHKPADEFNHFVSTTEMAMRYFPGLQPRYARKLFTTFIRSDNHLYANLVEKTNFTLRQRYLTPRQQHIINEYFLEYGNRSEVEDDA